MENAVDTLVFEQLWWAFEPHIYVFIRFYVINLMKCKVTFATPCIWGLSNGDEHNMGNNHQSSERKSAFNITSDTS